MTGAAAACRLAPPGQPVVVAAALAAFAALAVAIGRSEPPDMVALFGLGGLLGVALYHAAFGFTAAYRALLTERRSAGVRAQLIMLAVACALFFPALAAGSLFGRPVAGSFAPVGVSVAVGAFLFGVGMQLGGGCASGTLYTVGGGSTRMVVTLACFILGSVAGVAHAAWWQALPALAPASLVDAFGWPAALAGNLLVFGALFLAVRGVERRRHGDVEAIGGRIDGRRLLRGPWPVVLGGVALALLNFTTLYLSGRPWAISGAFGVWGVKLLGGVGIDVSHWGGWATARQALARPVLGDVVSVMDFGIMLGALLAAALAGRFAPTARVPGRHLLASVVGGLLLGYGARLAYGCNIGAFFSGVASGSAHGWLWIAGAVAGSAVGVRLRPAFGLGG